MNLGQRTISAFACFAFATAACGQTVNVGTSSSLGLSYFGVSQSAGPFPWSDLGVSATASVTPGGLGVVTGGSTAFTLTTPIAAGDVLHGGSSLNVSYTPGWTGSFSGSPASGNLSSSFVYNIGPLSGSDTLLNVPVSGGSSPSGNLAAALNAGSGVTASSSVSGAGPSASVGYTLSAQACFFGCVTVASASVGVNVGTQVQQTVAVTPTVTYGDLVWISTTAAPSYSTSDLQGFVTGTAGAISNGFNPAGFGLTNGEHFYYNILPVVSLSMPITNDAELAVPASITASYNILGVGGSQNFPLGNLYTLDTGAEGYTLDATFHNNDYYSIPLTYQAEFATAGSADAIVSGNYTGQLIPIGSDPIPPAGGPCGTAINCNINVPGGTGTIGGYGTQNLGPLFPGDPSTSDICGRPRTAYAGDCINHVVLTSTASAPEIDPASMASALTLLLGGLAVIRGRRRTATA